MRARSGSDFPAAELAANGVPGHFANGANVVPAGIVSFLHGVFANVLNRWELADRVKSARYTVKITRLLSGLLFAYIGYLVYTSATRPANTVISLTVM